MSNTLIETNWTGVKSGSYTIFLGMWYYLTDAEFTQPEDFTCGARYDSAAINIAPIFGWRVPVAAPALAGVYGYLTITFGNYDDSGPLTPITPKKVNQIATLSSAVGCDFVGSNDTSVLHEFWLTTTPHATGVLDKVFEIGAFMVVATSTVTYMNSVTQIGTFTDPGGRQWTVARDTTITPNYVMFRQTNGQRVTGDIYWKEMLAYLIAQSVITGNEYFNGLALGPEPRIGPGAVRLSLVVQYA